ncbi:hypothetical protein AGABI1DRAFT_114047 [Agaricus bisporus var. burnettii JB137-S8]|uniref:Replication protein A subunit n=1 Tax=Agaricus bisporus var. burnettii (strain JB137-S8 / ATCC MYA-4627 / FGSC 10392) TaxID=597362 RepID=K5XWA8_AGABU|nr:uncharacterized protein AGABI1DRAFT_114047 [Agaricus bisporus var. burnettii JB137-S8]EKM79500.1 hypothetical protein AGABI1DRAFT_114047 [Agaricus bisporus var. burnettii JB137-S8]
MNEYRLSVGCCEDMQNASNIDDDVFLREHVVQFLSVKKVNATGGAGDRYRLIISDGKYYIQAMLATQCNSLVETDQIKKFSVAAIERASSNTVQGKRLVIVLSLRILGYPNEKINNPQALDPVNSGPDQNASAEAPPAPAPGGSRQVNKPNTSGVATFPIENLSPYQNNWTIKARVTQKSDIKNWSNSRGEGKLFSVTLMDDSGEIKATAFNSVVDELFPRLEDSKVYYISKARVNFAKKKFSNVTNDYELTLERSTQITECHETTGLPEMRYTFVGLEKLENLNKDAICDVIGVLKDISAVSEITARTTNRSFQKRELTLVDKSGCSIQLTLWGKQAESFTGEPGSIGAFKGVKVGDFGGVSLSTTPSTHIQLDPHIQDCYTLRGWWDSQGSDMSFQSKTVIGGGGGLGIAFNRAQVRSLNEIKEAEVGMGDKADTFCCQGTIVHIRDQNLLYPACPGNNCNKKMSMSGDTWVCDKCGTNAETPEYRYILSMAVADWSGQAWLQGFNEAAVIVFGMSGNELYDLKMRDEDKYNAVIHKAHCQTYNFACRAKKDSYEDRVRIRYGISRIEKVDYHAEAQYLRDLLRSPWAA